MGVSLYQVQKLLFHVNRDPQVRARFLDERERLVQNYELTVDCSPTNRSRPGPPAAPSRRWIPASRGRARSSRIPAVKGQPGMPTCLASPTGSA